MREEYIMFKFEPSLTNQEFHHLRYYIKEFVKKRRKTVEIFSVLKE